MYYAEMIHISYNQISIYAYKMLNVDSHSLYNIFFSIHFLI